MIIALIGESCTGKTTLAQSLQEVLAAKVMQGKEYLKMAKNPLQAKQVFQEYLNEYEQANQYLIYVIAEQEQAAMLPDRTVRILMTADLELKLERFATRMKGTLPPPVEQMIRRNHGQFDQMAHDMHIHNGHFDMQDILLLIGKI